MGFPGLVELTEASLLRVLKDVRNTTFKVGGTACLVSINCRGHPTSKARDQQGDHLCRVAERVGREFFSLQPDRVYLLGS
jgi:hypothetical protein